jgi:hypothetical protein
MQWSNGQLPSAKPVALLHQEPTGINFVELINDKKVLTTPVENIPLESGHHSVPGQKSGRLPSGIGGRFRGGMLAGLPAEHRPPSERNRGRLRTDSSGLVFQVSAQFDNALVGLVK